MKLLRSNHLLMFCVRSAHSVNACGTLVFGCRSEDEPNKLSHDMMALLLDTRLLLRKVKDLRCLTPRRNRVKEKWVSCQCQVIDKSVNNGHSLCNK